MGKKLTDDDINSLTARGEAGDFLVCVELGERYFEGKGVGVDYDKAEHFFLLAEKAGLHCENGLGCVYLSKDTPEDFVKAVDYFERSVENGNEMAWFYLGYCYENGFGVKENQDKAIERYKKAIEFGIPLAMLNCGNILLNRGKIEEAIGIFERAVPLGESRAAYNLGFIYEFEHDFVDGEKSLYWYKKAVELGDVSANHDVASLYYRGEIVEKDVDKAFQYYKAGADKGDADCITSLAICYHKGEGAEQCYKSAFELFKKAAKKDNAVAEAYLGEYYSKGYVRKDLKRSFYWYKQAALNGHADAQYNVGVSYEKGVGVAKDSEQAFAWYRQAAENGCDEAQYDLAEAYDKGTFFEQNDEKAFQWYLSAAENGHALAMHNLGCCYYNGQGTQKNLNKAREWWEKAIEKGCSESCLQLGNMYYYGIGTDLNYEKGVEYFQKAANNANAFNNLGIACMDGKFLPVDNALAVDYFNRAIDAGSAQGCYNLGRCYEIGAGVERNLEEAAKLYLKAIEGGVKEAFAGLARVVKAHEEEKNDN